MIRIHSIASQLIVKEPIVTKVYLNLNPNPNDDNNPIQRRAGPWFGS